MNDDSELLRRYAEEASGPAFAELVSRHLGLVYHAALRQVSGDARRAEEVTQTVFIDLARKAASLTGRPELAGWLHTSTRFAAINLRRAERRRRTREQEAFVMDEILQSADSERVWERVRPVIDDALHGLAERDREAVLLRFFEGLAFSAVGARLSVTEDAARVRVERALEKIRRSLAHRGVTSTSAALATALGAHASAAAPAALAPQIAAATFAAGAGVGACAATVGLFSLMTTAKTVAIMGALLVLAAGIAIHQGLANKHTRASLAAAKSEQAGLRAKVLELEQQLASSAARARAAEEEGSTLLNIIDETAKAQSTASAPVKPAEPITRDLVDARYARARELAKSGHGEEALKEFLWCYDEGMPRFHFFGGVRQSFLLNEIINLGKTYPPALEALRERRDKAERAMLASESDDDAAMTFASINGALDENGRTLQIWDQLPPNDSRRADLGSRIYDDLVKARRYQDAVQAMPWRNMSLLFQSLSDRLPDTTSDTTPEAEKRRLEQKAHLVKQTAGHIEVLAGAGDVDHARELAARLLIFDDSPETRTLVREGLARVGRATLLDAGTGK